MKRLTIGEISELSQREVDDLLGYFDCPGQVHPVYSESIDEQMKLAKKFNISYEINYNSNEKEERAYWFDMFSCEPFGHFRNWGKTKRTGADILLYILQKWVIEV
jgi:hypothetical protein